MANYQSANFNLRAQSIAGRKEWVYEDTGPLSDVVASGFVSDGAQKGCDSGDFVKYYDTSRGIEYGLRVSNVTDTGNSQVTLDGQVIIGDTS
jgi:hypothetical protein